MWVNGEETECWPQELFVVKLHDDDGFSFDNEDYDDEDDDAPQATNEELSAEWLSLALPEFTRLVYLFLIFLLVFRYIIIN